MKLFAPILIFAMSSFCNIDFSSLVYDYSNIPDLSKYQARDKSILDYRYYPSTSGTMIILLHGSGYHSRYFYKLAKRLSVENIAQIVTPDLRGHGINPVNRGDVDYIGQLDDDLDDLIQFCKRTYQSEKIIIAGHSSGGGLALRLAGNKQRAQADAYLLLAPYLAHDAPTINPQSTWAEPHLFKIIMASILNGVGCSWLDHAITISFNMPEQYRDGSETLSYTHALISSYSPINYRSDLANISKSTLLLVGENDEAMQAQAFKEVLPDNKNITLKILPKISHMGIVTDGKAISTIANWLASIISKIGDF